MRYINYIKKTSLANSYTIIAQDMFQEWSHINNIVLHNEDTSIFLETFCQYLYDAKLKTFNKYGHTVDSEYLAGHKLGFFIGYFFSTLTIEWKRNYHLKYQENYNIIVWFQSLLISLNTNTEYKDTLKKVYAHLLKQNTKDMLNQKSLDINQLINANVELTDKEIEQNMVYVLSLILDKFDLEASMLPSVEIRYRDDFQNFINEPMLDIVGNSNEK